VCERGSAENLLKKPFELNGSKILIAIENRLKQTLKSNRKMYTKYVNAVINIRECSENTSQLAVDKVFFFFHKEASLFFSFNRRDFG